MMNGWEAVAAQRAAEDHGRVLLEGTHPTCHPVTKRVRQMILEGKIGLGSIWKLRSVGRLLAMWLSRAVCFLTKVFFTLVGT